jgi:imidazolonepropionase-like amidohydrolase
VNVVDVESGALLPDRTVVLRQGRIVRLEESAATTPPADARLVDGSGGFLMPGLWDMHAHLPEARWSRDVALRRMLVHGVTGVRSMGTDCPACSEKQDGSFYRELVTLREEIRSGRQEGPRLVFSSAPIDGPPGTEGTERIAGAPEDGTRLVGAAARAALEEVTVFSGLTRETFLAVATAAHQSGLVLIGTVPHTIGVVEATAAGLRSQEGLTGWLLACSADAEQHADALRTAIQEDHIRADRQPGSARHVEVWNEHFARIDDTFDADRCAAIARRFAALAQGWVVPKLVYHHSLATLGQRQPPPHAWPGVDQWWQDQRAAAGAKPAGAAIERRRVDRERQVVAILHAAGVALLAGTETYAPDVAPGVCLHEELALLVGAGLSPLDALRTATLEPARFFALQADHGKVAVGALADLVLLDADPLADIRNTRRIRAVVAAGHYLDRAALDALAARADAASR